MTKKQMINRLVEKCIEINGLSERKKSKTGNLPTVFFEYAGHVSAFEIQIHENGWEPDVSYDKNFWIRTDNPFPLLKKEYKEAMQYLEGLKNVRSR